MLIKYNYLWLDKNAKTLYNVDYLFNQFIWKLTNNFKNLSNQLLMEIEIVAGIENLEILDMEQDKKTSILVE